MRLAADAVVGKAHILQLVAVIDVAAVDDDGGFHQALDGLPGGDAELTPLG